MEQTTTNRKRKAQSRVSNRGGLYMLIKWLCVFAMGAFVAAASLIILII